MMLCDLICVISCDESINRLTAMIDQHDDDDDDDEAAARSDLMTSLIAM